jgi:hypothetical protein
MKSFYRSQSLEVVSIIAFTLIVTCTAAGAQKGDIEPKKSLSEDALKSLTGMTPAEYEAAQAVQITKTVKHCVAVVHAAGKCGQDSCPNGFDQAFFQGFDDFYNPASGKIENNVTVQGERKAMFVFRKCMAEKGVPLD